MTTWPGVVLAIALVLPAGCAGSGRMRGPVGFRAPVLTGSGHIQVTVDVWARMSSASGAIAVTARAADDVPHLMRVIQHDGMPRSGPVDLVYVVDTTNSMRDDIGAAKAQMRAILGDLTQWNPDRRVGIVAYRDRGDPYVAMVVLPLAFDEGIILAGIDGLRVKGGGDLREHVYAGLHTALHEQPWRPGASHHIILIGDAPPHEDYGDDPRNQRSVLADAARPDLAVKIHTITAYCDKECQQALAEDGR